MIATALQHVPATSLQTASLIFVGVVALVGGLAGIVLTVLTIVEKIRGRRTGEIQIAGQPISMKPHEPLATKAEVQQLGTRLEEDIDDIRAQFQIEREASRDALGKVHRRIDELVQHTSESKGELRKVSENVSKILDKLIH